MNKLKLQKPLISVVCVLVSLCLVCPVFAAELFSPAKSWYYRTSTNQAHLKHYDYNLSDTYSAASISSGYEIWETSVSSSGGVRVYNESVQNMNVSGCIVHIVPVVSFWEDLFNNPAWASSLQATTESYDSNGTRITEDNMATTTAFIGGSNIYYHPVEAEGCTLTMYSSTEFASMIAHEIGHCLGFGHVSDTSYASSSIMHLPPLVSALSNYDKACLLAKYLNGP